MTIDRERARAAWIVAALLTMATVSPLLAEDGEEELGWADTAEFAYVVTSGNTESSTLGFKNTLTRTWELSEFKFRAGGIRVETTDFDRRAVGTATDFEVVEEENSDTQAENYYAALSYKRDITETFFWHVGLGWERNRPAGIDDRYVAAAGVGNTWVDTDKILFRTDYSATYTDESPTVDLLGIDVPDSFAGVRFSWEYGHQFTESTKYENLFTADLNLDETDDWRGNMTNSVAVNMSERIALKVALQWIYDNQPAFEEIPLEFPAGTDTGETVPFELDELDTVFTTALVINF